MRCYERDGMKTSTARWLKERKFHDGSPGIYNSINLHSKMQSLLNLLLQNTVLREKPNLKNAVFRVHRDNNPNSSWMA
jgi:hypothetical protein